MSYGEETVMNNSHPEHGNEILVVDLRSDTLTSPTKAMRMAMFNAEVGDDVFEEDPTVKKLETKAAELLGKEAAIFVTSGTMGNLIAIMNHCNERGSEAYCGDRTHVVLHEQGGAAQLGGVTVCTLPTNPDGTFDLIALRGKLKRGNVHETISKLVIVENTNNGRVIPMKWINELASLAKERGLKLHMDGARIWNASTALNVPAKDIARNFDSITFCLSKGLGAPVGSLLCGNREFVSRARRTRKVLGGGLRQVGVLAAAGLVALQDTVPLLPHDHRRTRQIAQTISDLNSKIFTVDMAAVQTNMIFVNVNSDVITATDVVQRLAVVKDEDCETDNVIVKCLSLTSSTIRIVLYHEINDASTEAACRKIAYVMRAFDRGI